MKGIILAGGSGTRLYPMTKSMSKQMLPVYDKPMIYYPLSTLMLFSIKDILVISTPDDTPVIAKLLGDGAQFGINLQYQVQPSPDGLAQAFILGEDFIGGEPCALILGDNIFHINNIDGMLDVIVKNANRATIFAHRVSDPKRFGVIEFDRDYRVVSLAEKPEHPRSNYASIGLYFYPADVAAKAKTVKPSARGELEITDLSNLYLSEGRLAAIPLGRGNTWIDAGTPDSLMDASQFVQITEKRQAIKIACLEEIALRRGFIGVEQVKNLTAKIKNGDYRDYLDKVLDEYGE
ncbi:glucose-1-phosphate thymidylyltransferase [Planctomycetales bacterium]|nr:glucose-1-phosphate thymidylyltransferase [Planctomycetales bacterium]GHS99264.1 glucose-1-phosphate thymidylyltransferase [Planctomycetales bacterium]GHT04872.1 glucose-1-phosphate thymidylyltransferase [Planctomycetales bacterium]